MQEHQKITLKKYITIAINSKTASATATAAEYMAKVGGMSYDTALASLVKKFRLPHADRSAAGKSVYCSKVGHVGYDRVRSITLPASMEDDMVLAILS